jgi:acyl carrier protein
MTIEEMIERCPDLIKITSDIMIEVSNKLNLPLDLNKSWNDNGYDNLDVVELIMELEKVLNIDIPDDVVISFIEGNRKPVLFTQFIRNKKIKQLGL